MVNNNTGTSQQIAERKQAIFNAIWNKFTTLNLNRIDGQGPLKYYGEGWKTQPGDDNHADQETGYLLFNLDAQCGNWADMFIDTLDIQGVSASIHYIIAKSGPNILHNNHYDFYGGFVQSKHTVQGGNINLEEEEEIGAFGWHAVVKYNNNLYDPSIGIGPISFDNYIKQQLKFLWFCDINGNGIIDDNGTHRFYSTSNMTLSDIKKYIMESDTL